MRACELNDPTGDLAPRALSLPMRPKTLDMPSPVVGAFGPAADSPAALPGHAWEDSSPADQLLAGELDLGADVVGRSPVHDDSLYLIPSPFQGAAEQEADLQDVVQLGSACRILELDQAFYESSSPEVSQSSSGDEQDEAEEEDEDEDGTQQLQLQLQHQASPPLQRLGSSPSPRDTDVRFGTVTISFSSGETFTGEMFRSDPAVSGNNACFISSPPRPHHTHTNQHTHTHTQSHTQSHARTHARTHHHSSSLMLVAACCQSLLTVICSLAYGFSAGAGV